ncbi:MAG: branched-chain amino acid ABC transporter permease [Nitrospirae bacterium]|nr:branched-chain amino acid ABC transporter permease [Nitrospirota bacterium]MBI3351542.1 branched-chain amino acid ABC transporter permease [Nitrospirota bacterium]
MMVSLWFGLLGLPFMGWINALKLSGVLFGGGLILRHAARLKPFYSKLEEAFERLPYRKSPRFLKIAKGAGVVILLGLPLGLDNYQLDVLTMAGLYIVLALGLNIVVGFAGLLDLGYAAFYAVGAYSYALISTHFHLSFWLALPVGAFFSGCFGFALGVITLRLKGDYLAITTLGFIQILHLVLNNWDSVTHGPKGILGVSHPQIGGFSFTQPVHYYYLILVIVFIAIVSIQRINYSRIGRAWIAIREDEIAAESMGLNTTKLKVFAFVLGASWAGIAGTFFAGKFGFVSPESFTFFESILILSMVVLGGIGSIPGVVLGALILIILPEALRQVSEYRMLVFGLAMILMMVLRPQGMIGNIRRKLEGV